MKEIKIIPISGGLDSTYLLYHYLKDTNYTVYAHHIMLKSKVEPRWEEELAACKSIVTYCKNIRNFKYTESVWEFPYHCWDFEVVAFCAGQIAVKIINKDTRISLLAGRVKEDDNDPGSTDRLKYMQTIWRASSSSARGVVKPRFEMPLRNLSKYDLLKDMPKELSDMCWSCRHSDNGEPCGRCKSCKDLQKAKDKLDHDIMVNKLTDQ